MGESLVAKAGVMIGLHQGPIHPKAKQFVKNLHKGEVCYGVQVSKSIYLLSSRACLVGKARVLIFPHQGSRGGVCHGIQVSKIIHLLSMGASLPATERVLIFPH